MTTERLVQRDFAAGGQIRFAPGWLPAHEASELERWLIEHITWTQGVLRLFGTEHLEPRLSAWVGDFPYTYSGRALPAVPWPERLRELRARVEAASGVGFNSVLLNRYRSGRDSMGYHSDDEPELGTNPVIASLSFGAARRFLIAPKKKSSGEGVFELELGHGSLLVMGGALQHHYRHALPKQPARTGERLNLTFRWICPAPSDKAQ